MKIVARTLVFHFFCIIFFALIYLINTKHFSHTDESELDLIDYVFLSTTIQAGIGYSHLYPTSDVAKLIMILQQFVLISTHVFTIYIFTL